MTSDARTQTQQRVTSDAHTNTQQDVPSDAYTKTQQGVTSDAHTKTQQGVKSDPHTTTQQEVKLHFLTNETAQFLCLAVWGILVSNRGWDKNFKLLFPYTCYVSQNSSSPRFRLYSHQ